MANKKLFFKKESLPKISVSTVEDIWMERIIHFLGVTLGTQSRTPRSITRNLFSASSIIVHITFFYSFAAVLIFGSSFSPKRTLSDLMSSSFSIILWYHIQFQSSKIREFWSHMAIIPKDYMKFSKKERFIFKMAVLLSICFPFTFAVPAISFIIQNRDKEYASFWLLRYHLHGYPTLKPMLVFICMIVYFSAKFFLPSLSATIYAVYSHKLSKAIRVQNEMLKNAIFTDVFPVNIKFYNSILHGCKLFNDCFKVTMFLLLFAYCSALYTGLGIALRQNIHPNEVQIIEFIFIIAGCVFSVVMLLVFASSIPTATSETRRMARERYQHIVLENKPISLKNIMLLKTLEEVEIFHLTAWDILCVDKSLILSLFGTALSFCILLMQLKRVDLESI
ncbi:hypothetical protein HNY73_016089 [Argiope bruennichi]|uniref:Uncharacterized protein n=1 Tax=Argiope bruennichi TaxID=94029 RepID=A0A8T0EIX0_ARGBR|nr:hypothetical protein HNY73_016089 [Argiope bruennichi]